MLYLSFSLQYKVLKYLYLILRRIAVSRDVDNFDHVLYSRYKIEIFNKYTKNVEYIMKIDKRKRLTSLFRNQSFIFHESSIVEFVLAYYFFDLERDDICELDVGFGVKVQAIS